MTFFEAEYRGAIHPLIKPGMRQLLRPKSCTKNSSVPVQCSLLSFSFHSVLLRLVADLLFLFFFLPAVFFLSFLDSFALVWFLCSGICSRCWRQVSVEEGEGRARELNVLCIESSAEGGFSGTQGGAQGSNSRCLFPSCCTVPAAGAFLEALCHLTALPLSGLGNSLS